MAVSDNAAQASYQSVAQPHVPAVAGVASPGQSLRRWQLALDTVSAGVSAAAAAVSWTLFAPSDANAWRQDLFAVVALLMVMAVTARTRASATAVGRVLTPVASRFMQMTVDMVIAAGIVLLLAWIGLFGPWIPVLSILVLVGTSLIVVPAGRVLARELAAPVRVVLVGSGSFASDLRVRLYRSRRVELTAMLTNSGTALADANTIERLCTHYSADGLLVAVADPVPALEHAHLFGPPARHSGSRRIDDVDLAEVDADPRPGSRPNVEALQRLSRRLPVTVAVQLSDGHSPLLFKVGGDPGANYRIAKRAVDVIVAGSALLVLSPVLAILTLCVGLESGRPFLFRQQRLGFGRRPFHILKLRTMRPASVTVAELQSSADAQADHSDAPRTPLTHRADPNLVTKVGAILRRTSLDEIPQLLNVLRGEMSLVGPRPFVPEECDALPTWAAPRFNTRPGLTGMWQVCGQHTLSEEDMCWLDLFYVSCWTMHADLRIVLLTPARLFRGSR